MTLPEKLLQRAKQQGYSDLLLRKHLIVAVSGGADSLALLFALLELRDSEARGLLHVAHVDHGFRGEEGRADANFVRSVAHAQGLECTIHSVNVPALAKKLHLSPEDAARRARYSFLAKLAEELGATIAVAHTADDQAETVLMGILRGAGLSGLAGMHALTQLRVLRNVEHPETGDRDALAACIFRPMLHIWRPEIEAYCRAHDLAPCTDSTNTEQIYLRNRVRLDLIPTLQAQYSPSIKEHLANLADIAASDDDLLDLYTDEEWQRVASLSSSGGYITIDTAKFAKLHMALRRRLVRRALNEIAGTLDSISFRHISSVISMLESGTENMPPIHLPNSISVAVVAGGGIIERRKQVDSVKPGKLPVSNRWPLIRGELHVPLISGELPLPGGWSLTTEILLPGELNTTPDSLSAHFDLGTLAALGPILLRPRQPGDIIQPLGMSGHKSLQDLYVDAKIPRILRDYLVLFAFRGTGEVLWVPGPGGRRSKHAAIKPDTEQVFRLALTIPREA